MTDRKIWNESKDKGFYIMGYDKDNDVYDVLGTSVIKEYAMEMASAVVYYDTYIKSFRRFDNEEPFDWFVVTDENGVVLKIFTEEYIEGITPNDFEIRS